jgi:histidyl-tRNA synthetase
VGFAIGLERLVELVAMQGAASAGTGPRLFIAALGEASRNKAFAWMCELNRKGLAVEMSLEERGLKSQMKTADKWNASHVLIVGEAELAAQTLILRDMRTKAQQEVALGDVPGALTIIINNRQES